MNHKHGFLRSWEAEKADANEDEESREGKDEAQSGRRTGLTPLWGKET